MDVYKFFKSYVANVEGQTMSLEAWSTVASFCTLVVIAATAIAALLQLRHTRSSNQIVAVTEMRETIESERFRQARRFVIERLPKFLEDPAERNKLRAKIFPSELDAVRDVGNFFETMGAFVKLGIVDEALVTDLWDGIVFGYWKQLEPVTMIRRAAGAPGIWSNFEYLAVICENSLSKSHGDHYPHGVRRMTIDQRSADAVAAFAKGQTDPSAEVEA
jgi:hypothetical protein